MRILSLDLDRYGPFTQRKLVLRPDARLHVVLGPNEAGKSCALAAVTDLLFGIEERTKYDFLHRGEGLRLGADIVARDGRQLTFYRRKGRKKVLSDADGSLLPDDALGSFLGGLPRSVFCNAFGMNAQVLRDGAREMLKSDGEIGASLFAAASGLRGFRDAAQAFEAEAATLYAPRAQKPALNLALAAYEKARKDAGAEKIGPEAWGKLQASIAAMRTQLDDIDRRKKLAASEMSRLRRLKAAAPVLAVLGGLAAEATGFAELPPMDEANVLAFVKCVQASVSTTEAARITHAALTFAEADLAHVARDVTVERDTLAIQDLVERKANYQILARDLPRVEAEAEDFERQLSTLAIRLGLPDAAAIAACQPTDMARTRLKTLLARGREIEAAQGRHARERLRLQKECDLLRRACEERGPLKDPTPLLALYEAIAPLLAELGRRDALVKTVSMEAAALETEFIRLHPAAPKLTVLSRLPLPSGETIRSRGEALDDASQRSKNAGEAVARIEADLDETNRRMALRGETSSLPDPATLTAARLERDAAWQAIRFAAFGQPGAPAGPDLADHAARFERANHAADAIADRLIADAQRAADQAADARQSRELARQMGKAQSEQATATSNVATADADWMALWQPFEVNPLRPTQMLEWRSTILGLVRRQDTLDLQRLELADLVSRVESARAPLYEIASKAGLEELESLAALDISLLDARATAQLRALKDAWDAARDGVARLQTSEAVLRALAAEIESASAQEIDWRLQCNAALIAITLPEGTPLDVAEAALVAWGEVPSLIRERDNRRKRVEGIERDMQRYETDICAVVERIGLGANGPIVEAVQNLQERAKKASDAIVLHTERQLSLNEAARAHNEAMSTAQRNAQLTGELAARFAIAPGTDFSALADRLEDRLRHDTKVRDARNELARAADGLDEIALRTELETIDPDEIEGRLALLGSEAERLDHESNVTFAERERLLAELRRIEAGTGAEQAAARKGAAETDIREVARRYVVLKLAALLLQSTIEQRRAGQQDPLLCRAGELFNGLTGGSYGGLDQVFDAGDQPVLMGLRAQGRDPVAIGNMSEGTQDQLYLALRLAYLEDYATRAEPAPFLGDDIFASFDDERTGNGLIALAAIGSDVQPILFTHHESVARIATQRLGSSVDIITLS